MKNKLKKSVFLLSSLMMLSVGVGVTNGFGNNTVNVAEAAEVVDVIDKTVTGITSGTNYKEWSGKSVNSSAVYAGQSAADSGTVQLRSKKSNSGIISTTSGGKIKKVNLTWNAKTTNSSRKLDVYGSNTAYTSPTNLYNSSSQGTKLGSIPLGSTELTITGDYAYVGVRSAADAIYLDNISFTWETAGEEIPYEYYVVFYDEKGNELKSAGTNGEPVEPHADQVKVGYDFLGWAEYGSEEIYDFTAPITGDVELYPVFEETQVSTIADVIANGVKDNYYKIEGEIYAKTGNNTYYIQDATGGMNLYGFNASVSVGNKVSVYGAYSPYYNLPELTGVELLEVIEDDTVIDTIPTSDINLDNVGRYIELNNITLNGSFANGVTTGANVSATDGTNDYTLRYTSAYLDSEEDLTTFTAGTIVNVRGALSVYNTTLQIIPTYIELVDMGQLDTPEVSFDEENSAIVWDAIEGASGYQVYVLNGAGEEVADEKVNGTSFDVSEFGNDSYSATVVALGNKNYSDSDEGEVEFTLNQGVGAQLAAVNTQSSLGFNYSIESSDELVALETTLTFDANKTNRESFSTTQQVWKKDGITFTNNKSGSSNNVADYTNPVRLYKGSEMIIESESPMSKIYFVCTSSYVLSVKTDSNYKVTTSGTNVTVEFVNPVDSFTVSSLSGQTRFSSITVTSGTAGVDYSFSDVRVRFAATISADVYEGLNIEGAGFVVTAADIDGSMNIDCTGKFDTDENGDYFIICSIWNIPEENYGTELTATAYFVVDGVTYYAQSTTYSVETLADAYMDATVFGTLTEGAQGAISAFNAQFSA